jgi:uncharacterized membrane protein
VLTFGTSQGSIGLAALGAGLAVAVVGGAGVVVHQPLSRVPENTMKFAVGSLLSTFGIFWAAEGVGVEWPGEDGAILAILAFVLLAALALSAALRRQHGAQLTVHA